MRNLLTLGAVFCYNIYINLYIVLFYKIQLKIHSARKDHKYEKHQP